MSVDEHLEAVTRDATTLATTLRDASDAGVSHALILPRLVLVFREAFGATPADVAQIPGLAGLLGGGSST